jgi:hypothetical protein
LFQLERETGKLRLFGELDYDNPLTREHTLTVIVEDLGEETLMGQGTLQIVVEDVDDLNPVFEPSSYTKSISENSTFVSS